MLPESVAQDVRPAWIPPGIRTIDVDWAGAARAYPESRNAIQEILLKP
jgi:iron(III) transport system substrate-binding protein